MQTCVAFVVKIIVYNNSFYIYRLPPAPLPHPNGKKKNKKNQQKIKLVLPNIIIKFSMIKYIRKMKKKNYFSSGGKK